MVARYWLAAVVVGVGAVSARANVVYATGFENPPFANGSVLNGQDGWTVPGFLSPTGAIISTALPASGLQGVRVRGADLTPDPLVVPAGYEAVGSYRRPVNYDALAAGRPLVRVSADLRLDGPQTAQTPDRVTGDFSSVNLSLVTASGSGQLSISSDGHVYGFDPTTNYLFGVPVPLGQYHNLAIEANFLNNTFGYFLNGQRIGTTPFAFTSGTVTRGSVAVYANLPGSVPGVARADYTAYFDNFAITANPVPEPATVGLFGALGLVLAGRARRAAVSGRPT